MLFIKKKDIYPIGIDLGSKFLKLAQLCESGKKIQLYSATQVELPADLEVGSGSWQRWAVSNIKKVISECGFKGRKVVAGISADELFVDHIQLERIAGQDVERAIRAKMKKRLPFDSEGAMLEYVIADTGAGNEIDVVVMAAEKLKVERHLAIFEAAKLEVESISVWPFAITNSFVKFFGRRESDIDQISVLLDSGTRHSNVVITKHKDILFARSVNFGLKDIQEGRGIERLVSELQACLRYFEKAYHGRTIDRVVFFSGKKADVNVCRAVAELGRELQVAAQLGDVMTAVEVLNDSRVKFDRRQNNIDWSVAFGLSLSA